MRYYLLPFILTLLMVGHAERAATQEATTYRYEIPQAPWAESFGNHRAVLQVNKPSEVVSIDFHWRRPDKEVDQRHFLIVNAATGDTVPNIHRIRVSGERCQLAFGPIKTKGTYLFYYLPYQVQPGHGSYSGDYLPQEKAPDSQWLSKAKAHANHPVATVTSVEARTAFDNFYPMEVSATTAEAKAYTERIRTPFCLFAEDRSHPIRMRSHVPLKWMAHKQGSEFKGKAMPNEYYAFQIGLWADKAATNRITYQASSLQGDAGTIPASALTCFNLEGTDPYGKTFKKEVSIAQGEIQPLWFGIDLPATQKPGIYKGTVTLTDATGKKATQPISIEVAGTPLADRGDSEPWKHSRLRWLNSTLGMEDTPTHPYTAMTVNGNQIGCLGRTVSVDEATGLPAQIDAWGTALLENPVRFVIQTANGIKELNATPQLTERTSGHVAGSWEAEDAELSVVCKQVMEFDGWVNYRYTLTPKKEIEVKDIRLEILVKKEVGTYFLGMGLPGQETPQQYDGKWDAPEKAVNNFGVSIPTSKGTQWLWPFDSFWIGNAHAGVQCEFRGSTYSGPLLNLYRPAYPESWFNGGKGGFSVRQQDNGIKTVAYSGERTLKAGQPITFDFAMIITPVKKLNPASQFTDRYYHNGGKPVPTEDDVKAGVKVINIHHANEYNPFINYPFLTVDKMKNFTKEWHEKGCKVKLYYTLRELTNATTELWAIRSLGHEILRGGNGGGFPWCREHMGGDYTPQWYQHFDHMDATGIAADAALLTAEGDSRWYNYYIEGLAWMVRNLDIDGIYLDDVTFDRRILKRMRRAMDSVKPGCLIDLHSNTGFSKGPANQYTEFFPYVDKVWFGESFLYNKMSPANYLVESSGIPFGLMGDMLHAGGNQWLGMQYGMTVRHPWLTEGVVCDPRFIWKIWDEFGIANAEILGFWEEKPAVTTTDSVVKATAYKKPGRTLLSIGNYSDEAKTVQLNIDWAQLGLDPQKVRFTAPQVPHMQEAKEWKKGETIQMEPRKGWLIYIE